MKTYTIATELKLYDIECDENYDDNIQKLHTQQEAFVDFDTEKLRVARYTSDNESTHYNYGHYSINELIEYMAVKDGVDVVQTEYGYGILAYYNSNKTLLEVLEQTSYEELELLIGDDLNNISQIFDSYLSNLGK